ncbi:periplasmic flagellar collar protein FlcA [Treponema sp.]|uniref:periplasmic flagellar collar protein FlcA n=1 Tax=Treponema sp. TaxID=166 RepID=UPI003F009AF0
MPGLKQLQQFYSDILNLGDEVKIRAARGEKPVTVKIPKDVADIDDSEDFANGLPALSEEDQAQAAAAEEERRREANDFSDFLDNGEQEASSEPSSAPEENVPDVSDLLSSSANMDLDDLDLSEFETEKEPEPEPEPEKVSIEDMDLESLLAMSSDTENEQEPYQETPADEISESQNQDIFDTSFDTPAENSIPASEPDGTAFDTSLFDMPSEDSLPQEDSLPDLDTDSLLKSLGGMEIPSETENPPLPEDSSEPVAPDTAAESADENTEGGAEESTGFNLSSEDSIDYSTDDEGESLNFQDIKFPDFDSPSEEGPSLSDIPDIDVSSEFSDDQNETAEELFSPEMDVPEDEPIETFDTSDINDLDFSNQEDTGFELGGIDSLEGDDDFNIPGFSDTETADLSKKPEPASVATAEENSEPEEKPKNTFTDSEYRRFQKNLAGYPLNVRIALEDFVVKNEFTDDAIFSVLEKVLKKAPARQVASELEKLLDISLEVPRDFERRSAAEYEAYKKSIEYQLKNRIIPGAIFTAAAAILVYCIFTLASTFIYRPAMASRLYKQGYALLKDSQYPQSEKKFDKALTYKPVKKWFFRYAQGYRECRQYDRSRMMYRAILQRYNHDKKAGLEWASMEAFDLSNYEESERILKREVLDYHINDSEAMLALGDLYLEWASDRDAEKFPLAKEQYDLLIQLYGMNNLYLSRQMRYFIRTDNLRQVLMYKEVLTGKKNLISSRDLIELSGYMLDKRYGKLRPSEENLRFSIEDVRKLLESALKSAPNNSVALYNMGRYFVETKSGHSAVKLLDASISAFESQPVRSRRDTYKYINAIRLLGEEKRNMREYLTAEELYGKGIEVFEREHNSSGFESDENVGKLYADLADLDYFISGDNEAALKNYQNAVDNKHDTSSVRYRIGYIQYQNKNFPSALGSFIKSQDTNENDTHLLLALANTLCMNGDNYIARGYYEKLLSVIDVERGKYGIILPQIRDDHADIVDVYMKASNNLGVALARIASATGDSALNASSVVCLQESLRAWDAMTRNQTTMIRLDGSNLAEQNIKYITHPVPGFEPEIYTEIPRLLNGEEVLN